MGKASQLPAVGGDCSIFAVAFENALPFYRYNACRRWLFASGKGQKMSFRPGQGAWGEARKVSGFGNWEVGDPFSFR